MYKVITYITMPIILFDDDYDTVFIQRPVPEPTVKPSLKLRSVSNVYDKYAMLDILRL